MTHPDVLEPDGGPWRDPVDVWGSRHEQLGPNVRDDPPERR